MWLNNVLEMCSFTLTGQERKTQCGGPLPSAGLCRDCWRQRWLVVVGKPLENTKERWRGAGER